jgi:transcriptional regulator with GAF, ATPase, and Fis domain
MDHLVTSSIINSEDLFEFTKILGQQTDYKEVLRLVAHTSSKILKADLALILMLNPDTRETVKTIYKEGQLIEPKQYREIHIHIGGWIVDSKNSFFSKSIQRDKRFTRGIFDKTPIKTVAGVPLVIEDIIIGALILLYRNKFSSSERQLIQSLENLAITATPYLRNTQKIREYFKLTLPESALITKYKNAGLYGKSPRFIEVLNSIEAASKCDTRVLLIGKTGTGKELIARAIHNFSSRANFPFVAVDCGAIPHDLLESEFFGHKRGAFTGAHSDHKGLFQEANGGTLFTDEINNLPLEMQSKLLRVLEKGDVRPLGSDTVMQTDVRIIAASSVPLKNLVDENKFREDLFYRLHVYPIYVPDLSERQEDISLLANHFLHQYAGQQNKNTQYFHDEVIDFMKQHHWAGNIRELENFVKRLITIVDKDDTTIDIESFPADLQDELDQFREKNKFSKPSQSLKHRIDQFEANIITQTLIECSWNQSKAARRLDTSEHNIRYKMEKLGIKKPN